MFYLEILLEDNGGVKDVKIHHDGKTEPQVKEFINNSFNLSINCITCFVQIYVTKINI